MQINQHMGFLDLLNKIKFDIIFRIKTIFCIRPRQEN